MRTLMEAYKDVYTTVDEAKAHALVALLQADEDDGTTYTAVADGGGRFRVDVFDATGERVFAL